MNLTEYIPVISDLAVLPSVILSNDTTCHSHSAICETVSNIKVYLEIPDIIKERLKTELPDVNRKIIKLQSDLEKLKSRMSTESYECKSFNAKELDIAKVIRKSF